MAVSDPTERQKRAGSEQTLGQWVLVRIIGEGPVFRLWAAKAAGQPPDAPPCYVVKMAREDADPAVAWQLLGREAAVGRSLSHPRIVPVLAAYFCSPCPYLVMPFLEGQSLRNALAGGAFPLWRAVGVARQIAEGLVALEEAGWCHGDLKPSNIHLGRQGQVTLLDLNFAARIGTMVATKPFLCGTPLYMAPELLRGRGHFDIRSDLFSLGLILAEMLTGRPPSRVIGAEDPAEQAATGQWQPDEWPVVPARLDRLIRRLLAQDPLRRPAHAHEVLEALIDTELMLLSGLARGPRPPAAQDVPEQNATVFEAGQIRAQAPATSSTG